MSAFQIVVTPDAERDLTELRDYIAYTLLAPIAEIEARAPRDEDIVYDEDCPPMTDEQLRQFRRVNPRSSPTLRTRKIG